MADNPFTAYMRGIRTSIRYNAGAYGYSVLITATFGALTALDGSPQIPHLFLFVSGAAIAFAVIEAVGSDFFRERVRGDPPQVVVLGSAFALLSLSAGLGAGCLVGWAIDPWPSWILGPFAATVAYLLVLGLELTLAERAERKQRD